MSCLCNIFKIWISPLTCLRSLICVSLGFIAVSQWVWVLCKSLLPVRVIQGLVLQLVPCLPLPFSLLQRNYPPSTLHPSGDPEAAQGQQSYRHNHSLAFHTCCSSNCRILWFGVFLLSAAQCSIQIILHKIYMSPFLLLCSFHVIHTFTPAGRSLQLHTYPQPQCQPGSHWARRRWIGRGVGTGTEGREVGYRERQSKAAIQSNEYTWFLIALQLRSAEKTA